jgi:hypothetical protein
MPETRTGSERTIFRPPQPIPHHHLRCKVSRITTSSGALVLWAIGNDRYRSVEICGDRTGDIEATYRNEGGTITYGMLAQKREDGSYSVHS